MTEEEWPTSQDTNRMLRTVNRMARTANRGWRRKFRLFACYTFRRYAASAHDERFSAALDVAERVFDGQGSQEELMNAIRIAQHGVEVHRSDLESPADLLAQRLRHLNADHPLTAAVDAIGAMPYLLHPDVEQIDRPTLPALVRDLFGNPFRPVAFSPAWRTSAAVGVAQAMYEARDFAAMPILADALEEAVCENAEVLAHCRGPGPHVRGCWVVDGVLGKA